MGGHADNIYDSAPCGIFSLGEDGAIRSANPYLTNLVGYVDDQLVGKHMHDLLGTAARIFYGTHLYPMVMMHGHVEEVFLKLRSATGSDIPVLLNATVVSSDNGTLVSCACIPVFNRGAYESEILAAKRKAELELEEGRIASGQKAEEDRLKELADRQAILMEHQHDELVRLGDIISHDLQEPLRKMDFYASEIQKKQGGDNNKALAIIHRSAVQIRHRLLQLQAYLDVDRDADLGEVIDIPATVREQLEKVRHLFPGTTVDLAMGGLATVSGNQNQLGTLFYELIKNAILHGSIDNHLRLSIKGVNVKENVYYSLTGKYRYKDHLKLTVSDSGKGFDDALNGQVFGILNRIRGTAALGVGLSICKRIVEVHGGRIWANGNVGKGAVFFLTFPIDRAV